MSGRDRVLAKWVARLALRMRTTCIELGTFAPTYLILAPLLALTGEHRSGAIACLAWGTGLGAATWWLTRSTIRKAHDGTWPTHRNRIAAGADTTPVMLIYAAMQIVLVLALTMSNRDLDAWRVSEGLANLACLVQITKMSWKGRELIRIAIPSLTLRLMGWQAQMYCETGLRTTAVYRRTRDERTPNETFAALCTGSVMVIPDPEMHPAQHEQTAAG